MPLNVGMALLPQRLRFFVETEKEQAIGKAIAGEEEKWREWVWRPVDMKPNERLDFFFPLFPLFPLH